MITISGSLSTYLLSAHKLMDDFSMVRPTIVASTPRFWTLLYNQFLHTLYEAYTKHLAETAEKEKMQRTRESQIEAEKENAKENHSSPINDKFKSDEEEEKRGQFRADLSIVRASDFLQCTAEGRRGDGKTLAEGTMPDTSTNDVTEVATQMKGLKGTITLQNDAMEKKHSNESLIVASEAIQAPLDVTEDTSDPLLMSDALLTPSNFDPKSVPLSITEAVLKRFRSVLGGREQIVSTGGAPTGDAVKKFMIQCFRGVPQEGYGTTEV